MKKHTLFSASRLVGAALLAACSLWAQAAQADSATWKQTIITPETALKAAQAAKAECAKRGWQVAVAVTDPSGLPLVLLRDRYAGWHTVAAAEGKARTAASWREATSAVAARVNKPGAAESAIKNLPGVVMIGGGLPIEAAGQMVGAIGVSGAPGGANDSICAEAGLQAITADLNF
ncbi:heme-binding protein [Candidatus Igneacidithiobacillus taiwanensis]|uniref:GlcG/HbpS family heme-binding protein n=1 Tax=Candidatus Igneacidithiobacillus taiwanensis TaxID=1945924 RepID=UPI00289D4854|nr:heme-binding protein [Candidatus Igneacidithiobacillus taiwanensis]MCE5360821.1 heme-binding protein [Acidithiobacillus sp.]